jgi:antirestriction protein ArdC
MTAYIKRDVQAEITAKIVEQLEAGITPWSCPWERSGLGSTPLRENGKAYRGANAITLWAYGQAHTTPYWLTALAAKGHGVYVKKGEKSAPIVYWGSAESKTKKKADGTPETFLFAKYSNVFNAEQFQDGLPEKFFPAKRAPRSQTWEDKADIEAFIAAIGATLNFGGDRAFYRPSSDSITLPLRAQFKSSHEYYSTMFHELTHWTGGNERSVRPKLAKRFGDVAYVAEELVAELGAAFLCAHFGLAMEPRKDHASYMGTWLKTLKADSGAIFLAAGEAQRAVDYLLRRAGIVSPDVEVEVEQEQAA